MSYQSRMSDSCVVGVGTSEGNSKAFSFADYASGVILVPSTEGTPTLTFYTAREEAGPYFVVKPNDSGTSVSVTTAGGEAKEIPPKLFGCHWLKIVASAISSGTAIPYTVLLKA